MANHNAMALPYLPGIGVQMPGSFRLLIAAAGGAEEQPQGEAGGGAAEAAAVNDHDI